VTRPSIRGERGEVAMDEFKGNASRMQDSLDVSPSS